MKRFLVLVMVCSILSPLFAKPQREIPRKFTYVDLQSKANQKLADSLGIGADGNSLSDLHTGEQDLGGVKFKIGEGLIQLGSKVLDRMPTKLDGIKVDRLSVKLHFLHATG